jgi:hypothetical protein
MAEIPYINNELQPGTVEYNETGRPIVNDTLLSFKTIKSTSIIEITGKELKNVVNYSAFFLEKNKKIGLDGERVNGAIRFRIPSVKTEKKDIEVIVWLTLKTKMKNKSIIEKKILINMK